MVKKNSGKAPSYQMYYRDWNEDTDLKLCSYAAEGLWVRLVNTSCGMPVQGVFIRELNGSLVSLKVEEILNLVRGNTREKKRLFKELFENNVIKKFEDGEYKNAFYCKRIFDDMQLRVKRKQAGRLGGNPNLVNQKVKQNDNQILTPSSSTSSSTSISLKDNNNKPACKKPLVNQFEDARFSFTTADMQRLVNLWNSFSPEQIKPAIAFNLTPQVIQVLLRDDLCLTKEGLFASFENYRKARGLKNTKAHPWTFGQFLQRDCALPKFREGFFRLEDYGEWEPRSRDRPAALTDEEKRKRDEQIRRELEAEGVKTT